MVNNDVETASREDLHELQSERLRDIVAHAYENVDYYRETLDEAGVSPGDIESVDDIDTLPFTEKEDFRDEYPDGMFAVDWADVKRIHASSGTTGKPKVVSYTEDDLGVWREVMARSLSAAGVREDHVVQNAYGYGLFTGGLGFHDGIQELGACVVPTGGGNTARQIDMLQDLGSDVLCCTPSYCLYLAEAAEKRGIDVRDLPLSTVIIGAEPFTDPMREEIEDALGVTAVDVYGLSEIIGPGVSIECADAQDGLHIWEDHFYPEIIDPATGEVLPEGEEGELVLTTLSKQALPVLRYRTGDMTTLNYDSCECGRTCVRMGNVTGRADDLLIVRGVNVYPSQIEEVMLDLDEVAPHYRIDLRRDGSLDTLELTVEHHEEYAGSSESLRETVQARLEDVLDVTPDSIDIVEPGTIGRTEVGKVQRVYDHR
ncbi:phenylacetate-CoA ligase [Halogranum gelatinilyticum]|uniref:Phenylacetate-CoA ligase n=1 Tax=Halogranum gelatinilyticum TaxID=660521 RepID=A0A1G9ZA42_9EURY|nr:phenylacetate--CoA ligase PaaK [Halogranum gelatinilyticum]SDN17937.1 phenylacetate-CoA ligase [Halogranum gelatinilyticum]